MKKLLNNKSLWKSFLSLTAIGIFILFATGSLNLDIIRWWDSIYYRILDDGRIQRREIFEAKEHEEIITGRRDDKGRWDGWVEIMKINKINNWTYYERVWMENGIRNGKSTLWAENSQTGEKTPESYKYYKMGHEVYHHKSILNYTADISSFGILSNKYSWFLFSLSAFGFEYNDVETFMDTLETVLSNYEFEDNEFGNYYQQVIEDLKKTEYDSIISFSTELSNSKGLEELKNDQLRMAVIDRYRSNDSNTYNILRTTYPGYLLLMNDAGVNEQDFECFCDDLDSCMNSYGTLNLEDPFFIDSVNVRMYNALVTLYNTTYSPWKKALSTDIITFVMGIMMQEFDRGDIIKWSVIESYFKNKGVISTPVVTTEFVKNNSATSVSLNGYIIEDGGAEVTERGVAWAGFYNPTVDDQTEVAGSGKGEFSVTLAGLTEGETYYARSYATNSAGTAYGNCIEFIAAEPSGIKDNMIMDQDLAIYPNPASTSVFFSFHLESPQSMSLTVVDLNGREVYRNELGLLSSGDHQVMLDLSEHSDGIYYCQIISNGTPGQPCKLVIAR